MPLSPKGGMPSSIFHVLAHPSAREPFNDPLPGTDHRGLRFRHDTRDGAVACVRLMLRCLLVVTVAFGLASAPLYTVAQASDTTVSMTAHHRGADAMAAGMPDHDHASPAKPHAMGLTCCHPGCVMALLPFLASLATDPLPWVVIPIPRDPRAIPVTPAGIDRPPKRA